MEETHFTGNWAFLIDLTMARNTNNIVYSDVADLFIPDRVSLPCYTAFKIRPTIALNLIPVKYGPTRRLTSTNNENV